MSHNDTIVAQATPPGRGGVGILRISGLKARDVAQAVLGKLPKPRYADYLPFNDVDGTPLDQGIALWFPGPNSFTGEDVLELQGHGGPVILDLLLKRILTLPGLRIARPGEFSERAFLNDKLDLAQAEAIADLIDASSEQAARSALNSLQGAFSARVNHLVEALTHLRIYVEAAIDFPDEEIDFLSDGKIEAQLNEVMADLDAVRAEARQGSLLGASGLTLIYVLIAGAYAMGIMGWPVLLLVLAAIAIYALTLAPVTWVLLAEIFPNRVRGLAMSLGTLALWIACFLLTYTFPLLNAGLGAAGSFLLYGVICAAGYLYILRNVPETKGITLEALEEQLAQRHTGVNAAKQEQMR